MINLLSKVKLADNSGVLEGRVIKLLTPKNTKSSTLGSLVLISCLNIIKNSNLKKGDKLKGVIVRLKNMELNNSIKLKFNNNYIVGVKLAPKNNEFLPIGTRIKGPVSSSLLRLNGYQKVISISKNFI